MLGLNMLSGYLRSVGRHRDAQEVDDLNSPVPARREAKSDKHAPSPPAPKSRPDMRWHGTENDPHASPAGGGEAASGSSGGAAPGTAAEAGSASQATGSQAAGAEAGGSMSGGHSSASGAGATETHDHAAPPAETPEASTTHAPEFNPHDPLAGLHSDRLRDSLSRDAFRGASGAAQDSAIVAEADTRAARIDAMPNCLRDALAPFAHLPDMPLPDHAPAARQARIDALGGEIPAWAKGDLQNDPNLLKMLEHPAAARDAKLGSSLASGQVRLRDPAGVPTHPAATVAARLAERASAEPAIQPSNQLPARAPRTSSGDREM